MYRCCWILALAVLAAGCKNPLAPKTASAFDRDPLVMAHLTHSKDDPAYRDTDTDLGSFDEPQLQPASARQTMSKKPSILEVVGADYGAPTRSRAADYSWLRGTVSYSRREAGGPGWFIEYGRLEKDRFGGRIRLSPTPRLGLLREGDTVHLSGKVHSSDPLNPMYEVGDIILLR